MSDMKCPFCNQPLHDDHDGYYSCYSDNCCVSGGTLDTWQELIRTRKELEQSEICCTEWEKQAIDYKAENIALSGDFERTRKALNVAVDALKEIKDGKNPVSLGIYMDINDALEQITALEQKD